MGECVCHLNGKEIKDAKARKLLVKEYSATPENIVQVIASANPGSVVTLSPGNYPLLTLVGKNAYPENLTIMGGVGVSVAGISITSGVKDQEVNSAYTNRVDRECTNADITNAILSQGLTIKDIAFTDSFALRNACVDNLTIANCTFALDTYIAINPNSMKDCYGGDFTSSSHNFETRRNYARLIPKNLVIRDCVFEGTTGTRQTDDGDVPIWIRGVDGAVIYRNTIKKASFGGITVGGLSNTQNKIYSSGRISITNNTISNTNQRGINIYDIKNGEVTVAVNKIENANITHSHNEVILASGTNTTFVWNGKVGYDSFNNTYNGENIYVGSGITETKYPNVSVIEGVSLSEEQGNTNFRKMDNGLADGSIAIRCSVSGKLPEVNAPEDYHFIVNIPFPFVFATPPVVTAILNNSGDNQGVTNCLTDFKVTEITTEGITIDAKSSIARDVYADVSISVIGMWK